MCSASMRMSVLGVADSGQSSREDSAASPSRTPVTRSAILGVSRVAGEGLDLCRRRVLWRCAISRASSQSVVSLTLHFSATTGVALQVAALLQSTGQRRSLRGRRESWTHCSSGLPMPFPTIVYSCSHQP